MNKIFIDCGGHCGCSVRKFTREIDKEKKFKIYTFECNEKLKRYYDDINTNLIQKAVWIENGSIKFFISTGNRLSGSTIMTDKKSGNLKKENSVNVECIDFPTWFKKIIVDNYVILKLDIEGSEYAVLEKMIKDNTLKLVKELYIEFHSKKMKGDYYTREKNIMKYLNKHNIKVTTWNALNYCKCKREDFYEI